MARQALIHIHSIEYGRLCLLQFKLWAKGFAGTSLCTVLLLALLILALQNAVAAQDSAAHDSATTKPVDFAREVLPILLSNCFDCHGDTQQSSSYRIDRRAAALAGGDWGEEPIVAGKPDESLLYRAIAGLDDDLVMPPEETGQKLKPEQIETIRRWIEQGADWPDAYSGEQGVVIATNHWSFQPLSLVEPPALDGGDAFASTSSIDGFIQRSLRQQGLELSPPADRPTLLRRLKLVMHGLLPTPQELEDFTAETTPAMWQQKWHQSVDQTLASNHYGERWASHWLDVVRFGESTGYEVNRDRENAWYYRDYVIESLNNDKPYDQFVMEQLAGDRLGVDVATGFLVGGPYDIVKSPDINLTLMQRQDELADYVNTTSTTFLGLTVACARCHNHKFDPILQRDYYALQAVFAGCRNTANVETLESS